VLTALATLIGVPRHFVIIGLVLLAVLGAGLGKCAYDRSVIRAHETKQEIKQVKRERKADTKLQDQKERDQSAADQRKKEIDDATKGIPDQKPSARQRARICAELLRSGNAPPECNNPAR
jgi:uncharacterized protein HemX